MLFTVDATNETSQPCKVEPASSEPIALKAVVNNQELQNQTKNSVTTATLRDVVTSNVTCPQTKQSAVESPIIDVASAVSMLETQMTVDNLSNLSVDECFVVHGKLTELSQRVFDSLRCKMADLPVTQQKK